MTAGPNAIALIKSFEGCKLKAYRDSAGIATIGFGSTIHRSGKRVAMGDRITQEYANELLQWQIGLKATGVNNLLHPFRVNQNQFDALVSFTYNVGIGALETSTLLKKVRKNPTDVTIIDEFVKWVKVKKKGVYVTEPGLLRRRKKEAALFFKPITELA